MPSPNAIMAKVLFKLGIIFNDDEYTGKAYKMYSAVAERVKKMPRFHLDWCSYAGLLSSKLYEVVIVGKDAMEKNKALQRDFLPTCIIMGSADKEDLPLLKDKQVPGKTMIYVCTDRSCRKPEEDVVKAKMQITE